MNKYSTVYRYYVMARWRHNCHTGDSTSQSCDWGNIICSSRWP